MWPRLWSLIGRILLLLTLTKVYHIRQSTPAKKAWKLELKVPFVGPERIQVRIKVIVICIYSQRPPHLVASEKYDSKEYRQAFNENNSDGML